MKRAILFCALVLGLALAGLSANLLRRLPSSTGLEWRRPPTLRVSEALQSALSELHQEVRLTYWVSEDAALPAHLHGLEEEVSRILEELERTSKQRILASVRHPGDHPEAASLLAARGLRPFRSKRIVQDEWLEESHWSSLWIESGDHEGSAIQPIQRDQLPELAELIAREILRIQKGTPPAPLSLALVSQPGPPREALVAELSKRGVGAEVFSNAADVGPGFDALWVVGSTDPASEAQRVQQFLDSGRDVLIAARREDPPELLAAYGAYAEDGELRSQGSADLSAIAPNQDFRSYSFQPNGTLHFGRARSLVFSGERLAELRRSLQPLAWTDAGSELLLENGTIQPAPRRPLLTLLDPQEGADGRLVIAASTEVFSSEALRGEDPAHRNLIRLLLSPDAGRLALSRVRSNRSVPLPSMSRAQRSLWRTICIFSGPLALAVVAIWRTRRRRPTGATPGRRALRISVASLALALVAAGLAGAVFDAFSPQAWRFDATRERTHRTSPAEREFLLQCLRELGQKHDTLRFEFVQSAPSRLPAQLEAHTRDLQQLLADWQTSLAKESGTPQWQLAGVDPEADWTEEQRAEVRRLGPLSRERAVSSVDGSTQSVSVSEIWCGLILRAGQNATAVSLLEEGGSLRFRLAFALWRLASEETIDVAFAADRSLLSSAEVLLDYSERGLFAPMDGDSTHTVRSAIRAAGFDLLELDPRADAAVLSERCADADVICWLQPRREIGPMLEVTASHLANGGRALVFAGQHEIEARQLGRDALQFQFWPRPLKTDLDRYYFPQLGIVCSTELYFDASNVALPLPTRIEAQDGSGQARELQLGVQPFMVRASAQGIGDLALPSAARLEFDPERGAAYGLSIEPIVYGSSSWWSYDWSGGNVPSEVLEAGKSAERREPRPRQILSAEFAGRFPEAVREKEDWTAAPTSGASIGRLILTGNSAFLRDSLLATKAGNLGAEFLVDGLARLSLPRALADLNHRRDAPPPLEPLPSSTRMRARVLVLGLGPALLLLYAGLRALRSVRAR